MCQSAGMAQQQEASSSGNGSWKEAGNTEYRAGNYLKAAALYTKAIKEDPANEVLYSNRSAALLHINKMTKALADAEECIKLKGDWDKGHYRKAAALEALGRLDEALAAYQAAAERSPDNKQVADRVRMLTKAVRKAAAQQSGAAAAVANGR